MPRLRSITKLGALAAPLHVLYCLYSQYAFKRLLSTLHIRFTDFPPSYAFALNASLALGT